MKISTGNTSFQNIEIAESNGYCYGLRFHYGDPDKGQSDFLGSLKVVFSLDKKEGRLLDNNEGTVTFYNDQGKETKRKNIKILKIGSQHVLIEA